MTDSMIERVARAIDAQTVALKKEHAARVGSIITILDAVSWDDQDEVYRDSCRRLARVTIAAMREPTETMERTGVLSLPFIVESARRGATKEAYQAMIDEALK